MTAAKSSSGKPRKRATRRTQDIADRTASSSSPPEWRHFIAASEARAKLFRDTAPYCDVCGSQVASPGRTRHYSCEPGSIIGKPCTCPPGCSEKFVGDGPRDCDPGCLPCRKNRGRKLGKD